MMVNKAAEPAHALTQSTNHIFMIEPAEFYANPQTMETNVYQLNDNMPSHEETFANALKEFRGYRDLLVSHGVTVTTAQGIKGCPDMVFPNWLSTHTGGRLFLYPMLNKNRQEERHPALIELFTRIYPDLQDWSHHEKNGTPLEATGSLCLDRVNSVVYAALSPRTTKDLAQKWADEMGYELVAFETKSHTGKPVYHTDLVMHIGTTMAGLCSEAILEKDRQRVLDKLSQTHVINELSMEQLKHFCGNALEVVNLNGERMLAMSSAAHNALTPSQIDLIHEHFKAILHAPLPTLELYGGGSARCLLCEMF